MMPSWRAPQRSGRMDWARIKTGPMGSSGLGNVGTAVSSIIGVLTPAAIGAGIAYLKGWDVKKGAIWGFLIGLAVPLVLGAGLLAVLAGLAVRGRTGLRQPQGTPLPPLPAT